MDLTFERGDPGRPKGHAIVYVRDRDRGEQVAATYLVILPVTVDIAKYVPPFLAQQVPGLGERGLTAFAFPPAPEQVPDHDHVTRLAEARDDDLVFGGVHALTDPAYLIGLVGEIVTEYSARYERWTGTGEEPAVQRTAVSAAGEEVDDVVYGLMSEADRLNELTKLVGRLRYAAEGGDEGTADDAERHIRGLGRSFPDNRRIESLLAAARGRSPEGARLAQLYLERAYCLYREDYMRVKALDAEISALEAGAA